MMKKRLMIALCCFVLLVQLLPIVPMAETAVAETADKGIPGYDSELYYCRAELAKMPNGDTLVAVYDRIVAGVNDCAASIDINLSKEEFNLVLDATRRDHTEQFWLESQYGFTIDKENESFVVAMNPKYTMSKAELADAKVMFEYRVQELLGYLDPDMSDYEMVKTLHDKLAVSVDYVTGAQNAHNAYGALVDKKAVCEGYAESLQYLLQRAGIQSIEVFGFGVTNVKTGKGENHAWNIIRIDGEYYLIDLTWDDHTDDGYISYAYFNQTSDVFAVDHKQWVIGYENGENWAGGFALPECTATAANYYIKNDLRISEYDIRSIGAMLKKNDLSVTLWVDSDPEEFKNWFMQSNDEFAFDIAREAGVSISSPFRRTCMVIGHEVKIGIDTCKHEQRALVEAKVATCTEEGNTAYYVCQNKDCGKWFSDAEAKSEISNKDLVKISPEGHTWARKEDAAAHKEGETYWYTCSACGTISDTLFFAPVPEEPAEPVGFNAVLNYIIANPLIPIGIGIGVLLIVVIIIVVVSKKKG